MRENYHTGITLSRIEWIEVLHDKEVTKEKDLLILQTMYGFEEHQASSSQIGIIISGAIGANASAPINSEVGNWGKRLAKKFPVRFTKRGDGTERKWDIFFDGWTDANSGLFIWKMRNELIEALEEMGQTGEEKYPEEIQIEGLTKLHEGSKKTIVVNTYERNSVARKRCIEHWSPSCSVCDFDFGNVYGELGRGFIHVHHLIPISEVGEAYNVDPINDLRPVCPNCHSMLHRTNPPLEIDELRDQMKKTRA
ncbi:MULTISPECIES: HNH endonuclease [unclassified Imperialibacter]|uniref:HNH endonuclease n=1 Tax=unclassified Imperialibacter TaxID=2629706 RepID=UPI001250FA2D|nr:MULTISPECIES: HNH endonuclease [unclassified Imperialibacter]CAD5284994.1 conserved hypothetical protein [Imperialibacter sp. 75]CAD5296749.1 conserved hypothetical protein [Imperialibacter sp. 89]VVT24161.1 conserved hypothetical protein [Imperialibacter sp. EC-SDR9]